ncbi:hypothetical protein ABMX92_18075 [Vibrio vulnificus]|uniref:hypothetical protein n=1 Tax=Vibrio vulnificus TaxID=672 RepID=UPI001A29C84C|nr:hypothetical protein [Vibrio vulnificus]EIT6978090.1 hypothetical protein [Vibrio vulnificus]EIU7554819.1 hypothetical protein [Vibrio vulnificus]EIX4890040.1 hypothetical protein [Vibrio vulnificus]EKO5172103.1 hypothetical protein [Vibrio vulnificus]
MSKLFMLVYYLGQYGCGKGDFIFRLKPGNGLHIVSVVLAPLFVGCISLVSFLSGFYDYLDARWPVEYGVMHSKNFTSPGGFIGVLAVVVLYFSLKGYFSCKGFRTKFEEFKSNLKQDNIDALVGLPPLLIVATILFTVFLLAVYWPGILLMLSFYLVLEFYIRRNFLAESS